MDLKDEIRNLIEEINFGADMEDKLRRYIKREPKSFHKDVAERQLKSVTDMLDEKEARLARLKNGLQQTPREIVPVKFFGIKEVNRRKVAA